MRSLERIILLFICFGLPGILIGIGMKFRVFGLNGHWCWFSKEISRNIGIIYYIILWSFMISEIIFLFLSHKKVNYYIKTNLRTEEQIYNEQSLIKKVTVFPVLLIICWIFPTIERIFMYYSERQFPIEIISITIILFLGIFISFFSFIFIFGSNCSSFCNLFRECFTGTFRRKTSENSDLRNNFIN
jgi:hypothetical protein